MLNQGPERDSVEWWALTRTYCTPDGGSTHLFHARRRSVV